MPYISCTTCGKSCYKIPAEVSKAKFCSYACKYESQRKKKPESHGRWLGGKREKKCVGCKKVFRWIDTKDRISYTNWKKRKYCSLECSRAYQTEYVNSGEKHPNWKGGPKTARAKRIKEWGTKKYQNWRKSVFERDDYTCQFCGKRGGDIQADHIKEWAEYPELRYELSNGRTLCVKCHRTTFKFYKNQYTNKQL